MGSGTETTGSSGTSHLLAKKLDHLFLDTSPDKEFLDSLGVRYQQKRTYDRLFLHFFIPHKNTPPAISKIATMIHGSYITSLELEKLKIELLKEGQGIRFDPLHHFETNLKRSVSDTFAIHWDLHGEPESFMKIDSAAIQQEIQTQLSPGKAFHALYGATLPPETSNSPVSDSPNPEWTSSQSENTFAVHLNEQVELPVIIVIWPGPGKVHYPLINNIGTRFCSYMNDPNNSLQKELKESEEMLLLQWEFECQDNSSLLKLRFVPNPLQLVPAIQHFSSWVLHLDPYLPKAGFSGNSILSFHPDQHSAVVQDSLSKLMSGAPDNIPDKQISLTDSHFSAGLLCSSEVAEKFDLHEFFRATSKSYLTDTTKAQEHSGNSLSSAVAQPYVIDTFRVFFKPQSFEPTFQSRLTLSKLAVLLKTHTDWNVTVEGHADTQGNASNNLRLSKTRAKHVYEYLVNIHHVNPSQLSYIGIGESRPEYKEINELTRALNRRVEFHFEKKNP